MFENLKNPKDNMKKEGKNIARDSEMLLNDTESLFEEAAKATGDKAKEIYERIARNLNDAKDQLCDIQSDVADKVKETAKTTDKYVHDNPWQSVGIAAAVGALIGMLITRR